MIWDILFKVWKKGSSFSGENEYISVSNGVIILDGKDEICYGGDLKVMSDDFANITTYSTTIYLSLIHI